ncbi:MAG: PilZ domain-containing protein [Bacillota bacterium]
MAKNTPEHNTSTIFCKVSIDGDDKWVHGIITYINLDKNIAEIFLSAKYFKNYLKEGCKILIKSLGEDNETLFSGSITRKVISIRKQAITVQIDKIMNFANQRKFERFHVSYSCRLKDNSGSEFASILSDISLGGGLVYSDSSFDADSKVNIDVFISPSITLSFKGRIVRKQSVKNKGYNYGVQILDIDEENNVLLNELIEYLKVQKNHIAHEWKVFKRLKYTVYTISILTIFIIVFAIFASEAL